MSAFTPVCGHEQRTRVRGTHSVSKIHAKSIFFRLQKHACADVFMKFTKNVAVADIRVRTRLAVCVVRARFESSTLTNP